MAFPLFGALAVASALPALLKKYSSPQEPNFFVRNPQELEALIRQKVQAQYGGAGTNIRESLANAGLLTSGGFPDALTKLGIGQGQDIASQILDLYSTEFNRSRDFETNKYFQGLGQAQQQKQSNLDLLLGLGSAVGQYYGGKGKTAALPNVVNPISEFNPEGNTLEELLMPKKKKKLGFDPATDYFPS